MRGGTPRCRTHHQPAGWKCVACHSPLCPDCAAIQKMQHVEVTVCTLCRELASPLTRHRSDGASYPRQVVTAFAWPFSRDVLISLVSISLFVGILSFFSSMGRTVASLGLYAASYAIIRMTAANQTEFFVETSGLADLIWPVVKSGLIYLLLLFIAGAYVWKVKPWGGGVLSYVFDPVLLGLFFTGFVLGPMTTLMAACHAPFGQMINPFLVVAYIGKIGSVYWVALATLAVLGALSGLLGLAIRLLTVLPFNFIPTLIGAAAEVYLSFVSARVLGLLLYVHGDRVGYGVQSDYETPLLGSTQPRGTLPERAAREVDATVHEPIAVPAEEAPVPRSHAPLEFDGSATDSPMEVEAPALRLRSERTELDASALPSASDYFAKSVRESAARGDWNTALDAWKASPDKVSLQLDAEHLTGLGRTAASNGDNAVAREALELAAQGDAANLACARAKVFLGRLLHERFNEPAAAQTLFKEVIAKAPGSDAARFAQKMLGS